MTKVLFGEIGSILQAMTGLSDQKLAIKTSYSIMKTMEGLQKELQIYEELRKKLCLDYSEKDDKGQPVVENDSYKILQTTKAFWVKSSELLNKEVEIECSTFKLDDLSVEGVSLSPSDMFLLKRFIEE